MPGLGGLRIAVRRAAKADGPRCADIFLEGRRTAFPWQPAERFRLDDYYDCTADTDVLVAEVDGTIVGFVAIDSPDHVIHALFIDRHWQNRGIGSHLLGRALLALRGAAQLTCSVRNRAARGFYERQGWTPLPAKEEDAQVVYRKMPARP